MLDADLIDSLAPEDELVARFPRPLDPVELSRLRQLVKDAAAEVEVEFADAGRDLAAELDVDLNTPVRVLHHKVGWAIREMVSAAVLIGPNAGMRSVSSSTGAESDSATFADVDSVSWSGVAVTDRIRRRLGLPTGVRPRGRFPRPWVWPEVMLDGRPRC